MIASLRGRVAEKGVADAVIDVGGVGYRVGFSLLAMARLPEVGAEAQVRVRTIVREDAFDLFGFLSREEEELFLQLTSVSQVGPKMAINVLSGLEVQDLVSAISQADVARLTKIHGVGKKTAERLVLELKDKVKALAFPTSGSRSAPPHGGGNADLVSALVNLGYRAPQAESAAATASDRVGQEAAFEALFREALKVLRSG